jgi:hypothetical protein
VEVVSFYAGGCGVQAGFSEKFSGVETAPPRRADSEKEKPPELPPAVLVKRFFARANQ